VQAPERLLPLGSDGGQRLDPAHGLGIERAVVDIEQGLGRGDPFLSGGPIHANSID
jgi:hypothetical protein